MHLPLLRSNFNKEQLQMPLLQFLDENLPNVQLVSHDKISECQWKEKGLVDGGNMNCDLLHRLSMAYPHPSFGGYGFSNKTVKPNFLDADNLHNGDFGGYSSQRMSAVGMTPKTLRLPKKGEMLLSVHGSPLGVFNEDQNQTNMEAIHVDSIRWVRRDCIIIGCFEVTADGKEENYLVQVITNKEGNIMKGRQKNKSNSSRFFQEVRKDSRVLERKKPGKQKQERASCGSSVLIRRGFSPF